MYFLIANLSCYFSDRSLSIFSAQRISRFCFVGVENPNLGKLHYHTMARPHRQTKYPARFLDDQIQLNDPRTQNKLKRSPQSETNFSTNSTIDPPENNSPKSSYSQRVATFPANEGESTATPATSASIKPVMAPEGGRKKQDKTPKGELRCKTPKSAQYIIDTWERRQKQMGEATAGPENAIWNHNLSLGKRLPKWARNDPNAQIFIALSEGQVPDFCDSDEEDSSEEMENSWPGVPKIFLHHLHRGLILPITDRIQQDVQKVWPECESWDMARVILKPDPKDDKLIPLLQNLRSGGHDIFAGLPSGNLVSDADIVRAKEYFEEREIDWKFVLQPILDEGIREEDSSHVTRHVAEEEKKQASTDSLNWPKGFAGYTPDDEDDFMFNAKELFGGDVFEDDSELWCPSPAYPSPVEATAATSSDKSMRSG